MMYKVVMVKDGERRTLMEGLTEEEALEFCEDHDWQYDTGYVWNGMTWRVENSDVWDLRIEEEE